MFISVMICTRNRADSFRRDSGISVLFRQPRIAGLGGCWSSRAPRITPRRFCREFQQRFPQHFRFLTEKKLGKSNALNTAITVAKGDVLAFTDDDVLFAPDYIQAIRTFLLRFGQMPHKAECCWTVKAAGRSGWTETTLEWRISEIAATK